MVRPRLGERGGIDAKGSTMDNTILVGLSRQVALGRELDVVANNIANINTTGFKADGSMFEEYLSSAARTNVNGKVSFVQDRGTWHAFVFDCEHHPRAARLIYVRHRADNIRREK